MTSLDEFSIEEDEATRVARLVDAEARALQLVDAVVDRGLVRPGETERAVGAEQPPLNDAETPELELPSGAYQAGDLMHDVRAVGGAGELAKRDPDDATSGDRRRGNRRRSDR